MAANSTKGSNTGTDPTKQSAYDGLKQLLASWGLTDVYKYAVQYLKEGYTPDQVQVELEGTKEYKARFSGNQIRVANGMDPLDAATYISMEDSYRQIAKQYGLSSNYYSQATLAKLIGGGVSATEYQGRAQIALSAYTQAPQEFKNYWTNYGLTAGDAVSAIMDPSGDSLADLQMKANAVAIGGTAAQDGINVAGGRAMQLAENGTTLAQAQSAYQRIAAYGQTDQSIAKRFGTTFDQTDEENDLLMQQGAATQKRNLIYGEEASQFSGRGGASSNSLSSGENY